MATLKHILSSDYPGIKGFVDGVIDPVFGKRFKKCEDFDELDDPNVIEELNQVKMSQDKDFKDLAEKTGVTCFIKIGQITTIDGFPVHVYDITVSRRRQLSRNRKDIQRLIRTNAEMTNQTGAFMIFHYADALWEWRFSFCHVGANLSEMTSGKRYTYLLGRGQSCRTAADRFKVLTKYKEVGARMSDIAEAFSVEKVSKDFFNGYRDQYGKFVGYLIGKDYKRKGEQMTWVENPDLTPNSLFYALGQDEKKIRDYVKKMLGRIVFLHFLQKKGWMGVPADKDWGEGDMQFMKHLFEQASEQQKANFLDEILEPLFQNALDTNRQSNNDLFDTQVEGFRNVKIPYLNGGLFMQDTEDDPESIFPAQYFDDLFEFFYEYNFTIDENDPNDAEVGVDPEMLGKIFENLLEDNKDKGAFYTPKEIVQYMCRESLIAYLQTGVESEEEKSALRDFVLTHEVDNLSEEQRVEVDKKLVDVKICDPAIGSGAFPMGLLNELFECRMAIEGFDNPAQVKRDIIQNNIYGVDIEKGAVDIARLRFWLALIVDEKNPHALPNMDFKIMQGNSLLEQYEGVDLSGISIDEKKKKKAKDEKKQGIEMTLAFDERDALKNIQEAIHQYYLTDNHDTKVSLRKSIDDNVKCYILNLRGWTPEIQKKVQDLPIPNDQFFLWHIYFKEVFDKGGFDIMIANPPYIDSESMTNQGMGELRDILKKKHKCLEGNWDMYMAFLEFSLSIANTVVFITPDKWLSKPFGKKFRATRMVDRMSAITRAGSKVFENATVDAIITLFINRSDKLSVNEFESEKNIIKITNKGIHSIKEVQDPFIIDYLFANNIDVIIKMDSQKGKVMDLAECESACATSDAYKLQPYISNIPIPNYKEDYIVINTGTISKYYNRWGVSPMKYLGESYMFPSVKQSDFNTNFGSTYVRRSSRPKIIFKGLNLLDVCLDKDAIVLPAKTTNVICSEDIDLLKFLCGLLNSKLVFYYIKLKYSSSSYCGGITFTKDMINYLPVNTNKDKSAIVELVDEIVSLKEKNQLNDTSALETEIDRLVYELYGLTNAEVKLIDSEAVISGADNDLFKA